MPAPVLFSLTYHAFLTTNTTLAATMLLLPQEYHTHISRTLQPSTTDLYTQTQYTDLTKPPIYTQIQSTGALLLSSSLSLLSMPHGRSVYTTYRTVLFTSLAVVGIHVAPLFMTKEGREYAQAEWEVNRGKRLWKVAGVVGVNAVIAVVSAWASLGVWPWGAGRVGSLGRQQVVDRSLQGQLESMMDGFMKGFEEMAGGMLRSSIMGG